MHDDVGTPFQRLAEVGRGQGVVDDQRHAVGVGDGGDRLEVGDDAVGVGRALDEHGPGLVVDRGREILRARAGRRTSPASRTAGRCGSSGRSSRHRAWSSRRRCSPGCIRLRKVRNCAAWPEAVQQAAVPPSSAAIRDSRTETVGLVRRRVDVAELLQIEQSCRVVDVVEHVGRGLVDRHGPRAGGRIGLGAGVHRQGLEAVGALAHVRRSLLQPDGAPV